jgi:serine/threonine protein kinase
MGVPRVMDFGIAARVEAVADDGGQLTGTPAYMAPEYISQRMSSERSDIFCCLVFLRVADRERAVPGNNVQQVMKRISSEDIRLPPATSSLFDERLVHLCCIGRWLAIRRAYESAAQMREALDDYLEPEAAAAATDSRQSTIDFLLRRMRHKSDFPALSESVGAINRITASENQSISEVSNAILKDFSLTNKILRMVNSVYYQQAGGGNISTVSRAVVVLGLDAVRSIAITVLLLEHLQHKDNANQLKDEFLRANLAGCWPGTSAAAVPPARTSSRYSSARCSTTWASAEPVLLPRRKRRNQTREWCRRTARKRLPRCRCWGYRSRISASALPRPGVSKTDR